ncbi:MAG: hypothetical protein HYT42_02570 [Candidatus Sungbacteria bacterium]|nr:hypothetical protein [Candidatus Sungbacteria bacterium]
MRLIIFVVIVLAFLIAAALIFSWNSSFNSDFQNYFSSPFSPGESSPDVRGRLVIDFGNGRKRAFEGEVRLGMTVLLALRAAEKAGNFKTVLDERGRIVDIAGVKNNSEKRWRTDLNGLPVNNGSLNKTAVSAGDKIIFRYE